MGEDLEEEPEKSEIILDQSATAKVEKDREKIGYCVYCHESVGKYRCTSCYERICGPACMKLHKTAGAN